MRKQGYSVAQIPPFWEVVERTNDAGKLEHIVVDTSPRDRGHLPVLVFGPDKKDNCVAWAKQTALLYLTTKGSLIGDEPVFNIENGV